MEQRNMLYTYLDLPDFSLSSAMGNISTTGEMVMAISSEDIFQILKKFYKVQP